MGAGKTHLSPVFNLLVMQTLEFSVVFLSNIAILLHSAILNKDRKSETLIMHSACLLSDHPLMHCPAGMEKESHPLQFIVCGYDVQTLCGM